MSDLTYVLISDVSSIEWDEILESSEDTLRWNLAGTLAVVKFRGETPPCLEGATQFYDHDEIRAIVAGPDWSSPHPEP